MKNGLYKAVGAPTEAALVVLAEKIGLADSAEQLGVAKARIADPEKTTDIASRAYQSK